MSSQRAKPSRLKEQPFMKETIDSMVEQGTLSAEYVTMLKDCINQQNCGWGKKNYLQTEVPHSIVSNLLKAKTNLLFVLLSEKMSDDPRYKTRYIPQHANQLKYHSQNAIEAFKLYGEIKDVVEMIYDEYLDITDGPSNFEPSPNPCGEIHLTDPVEGSTPYNGIWPVVESSTDSMLSEETVLQKAASYLDNHDIEVVGKVVDGVLHCYLVHGDEEIRVK